MEHYRIKKVLEADYKPTDGEPFAVTWGAEGWVIWCRTPVHPGGRPAKKSTTQKIIAKKSFTPYICPKCGGTEERHVAHACPDGETVKRKV